VWATRISAGIALLAISPASGAMRSSPAHISSSHAEITQGRDPDEAMTSLVLKRQSLEYELRIADIEYQKSMIRAELLKDAHERTGWLRGQDLVSERESQKALYDFMDAISMIEQSVLRKRRVEVQAARVESEIEALGSPQNPGEPMSAPANPVHPEQLRRSLAEHDLHLARIDLEHDKISVEIASRRVEFLDRRQAQVKELATTGRASRDEVEKAELDFLLARFALRRAEIGIDRSALRVHLAERLRERNLPARPRLEHDIHEARLDVELASLDIEEAAAHYEVASKRLEHARVLTEQGAVTDDYLRRLRGERNMLEWDVESAQLRREWSLRRLDSLVVRLDAMDSKQDE